MIQRTVLLLVYLLAGMLTGAAICRADRVYRLVDHPGFQAGHSLRGTITTTDSAPDDFSLDTTEILDWQWSITGPNSYKANRSQFQTDWTSATGILITPQQIYLAIAGPARPAEAKLELSRRTNLGGRGFLGHSLHWRTFYSTTTGSFHNYSAGELQGDIALGFWSGPLEFGFGPWSSIAIAVPEPASAVLVMMGLAFGFASERRALLPTKKRRGDTSPRRSSTFI